MFTGGLRKAEGGRRKAEGGSPAAAGKLQADNHGSHGDTEPAVAADWPKAFRLFDFSTLGLCHAWAFFGWISGGMGTDVQLFRKAKEQRGPFSSANLLLRNDFFAGGFDQHGRGLRRSDPLVMGGFARGRNWDLDR